MARMTAQEAPDIWSDIDSPNGSNVEWEKSDVSEGSEESADDSDDEIRASRSSVSQPTSDTPAVAVQQGPVGRIESLSSQRRKIPSQLPEPQQLAYSVSPGPVGLHSPLQFFLLFFCEVLFQLLVQETNIYAAHLCQTLSMTLIIMDLCWHPTAPY